MDSYTMQKIICNIHIVMLKKNYQILPSRFTHSTLPTFVTWSNSWGQYKLLKSILLPSSPPPFIPLLPVSVLLLISELENKKKSGLEILETLPIMYPSFLPLYYKLFSISEQWWAYQQKVPNEKLENLSSNIFSLSRYLKNPDWKSPLSKVPLVCVSGSKILGLSLLNHLAMKIACSNINKEWWYPNPSIIWERRCCVVQKSPCTFGPLMSHGRAWTIIDNPPRLCVFMWSIFLLSLNFL